MPECLKPGRHSRQPTDRQRQILDFISAHIDEKGYSPSTLEIGAKFGIKSPNGVMTHLNALERDGHIRKVHGMARTIVVVDDDVVDDEIDFERLTSENAVLRKALEIAVDDVNRGLYESSKFTCEDFIRAAKEALAENIPQPAT